MKLHSTNFYHVQTAVFRVLFSFACPTNTSLSYVQKKALSALADNAIDATKEFDYKIVRKHSKFIISFVFFPFSLKLVLKVLFVFQALIFFDFIQRCKPDAFSADLLETVLNYIQKICYARYREHDCALAMLKTFYRKYLSMYIYFTLKAN